MTDHLKMLRERKLTAMRTSHFRITLSLPPKTIGYARVRVSILNFSFLRITVVSCNRDQGPLGSILCAVGRDSGRELHSEVPVSVVESIFDKPSHSMQSASSGDDLSLQLTNTGASPSGLVCRAYQDDLAEEELYEDDANTPCGGTPIGCCGTSNLKPRAQ